MHQNEIDELVKKIARLLALVPAGDVEQIVDSAKTLCLSYYPESKYSYQEQMIEDGEEALAENRVYWVMENILKDQCSEQYGFSKTTERIYRNPQNKKERKISAAYKRLHVDALTKFLETAEPTGYAIVFVETGEACNLLVRLGANRKAR